MHAYEIADEVSPASTWILGNIGNLYNNLKLYSKAVLHLQRAAELYSSSQYAHERLGIALKNQEDEEKQIRAALDEIKAEIMSA